MKQSAKIAILAKALTGTVVHVEIEGRDPLVVEGGSDHELNLKPGDRLTVVVGSDDRWLEKQQAKAKLTDLDKAARDDIAANPQAGTDLSRDAGMTLAEGLKADEATQPDVAVDAGEVTADTGATRSRSTRATR